MKDVRRGHWHVLHINETPVTCLRTTPPLLRLPTFALEALLPFLATDATGALLRCGAETLPGEQTLSKHACAAPSEGGVAVAVAAQGEECADRAAVFARIV